MGINVLVNIAEIVNHVKINACPCALTLLVKMYAVDRAFYAKNPVTGLVLIFLVNCLAMSLVNDQGATKNAPKSSHVVINVLVCVANLA